MGYTPKHMTFQVPLQTYTTLLMKVKLPAIVAKPYTAKASLSSTFEEAIEESWPPRLPLFKHRLYLQDQHQLREQRVSRQKLCSGKQLVCRTLPYFRVRCWCAERGGIICPGPLPSTSRWGAERATGLVETASQPHNIDDEYRGWELRMGARETWSQQFPLAGLPSNLSSQNLQVPTCHLLIRVSLMKYSP